MTDLSLLNALGSQGNWRVEPIPEVMLDRRVDIGDVSPDDSKSLVEALNSGAQVSSLASGTMTSLGDVADAHRESVMGRVVGEASVTAICLFAGSTMRLRRWVLPVMAQRSARHLQPHEGLNIHPFIHRPVLRAQSVHEG